MSKINFFYVNRDKLQRLLVMIVHVLINRLVGGHDRSEEINFFLENFGVSSPSNLKYTADACYRVPTPLYRV